MSDNVQGQIEYYLMQEAYYGKLPEFEDIEKLLDKIIAKIKKDPYKTNPNKFPETRKIEKLFSKVFGFKRSIIYWEPYNTENAYTIPINTFLIFANRKEHTIKKQDHGFYDTNHSVVLTVYLSVGLATITDLTARETLGCILHEIGHNFDLSGYHLISYYMQNVLSLGLNAIESSRYKKMEKINDVKLEYLKKVKKRDNKYFNNPSKRKKLDKEVQERIKTSVRISNSLIAVIYRFITLPLDIVISPLCQLGTLDTKKAEIFADSFATSYGYGVELSTALQKLSSLDKYYKPKSKIQKILFDIGRFQSEVVNGMIEPHGSNQERCKNTLVKLKKDLKSSDFPPELKEELENEINRVKEQYKVIVNMTEEEKGIFTSVWRKVNSVVFRGCPNLLHKLFKTNRV